ncbi:MAG: hemolysin III family protein [Steroidobacteraceae bacterium]
MSTTRAYTPTEEVLHTATHALGVLASLVAIPWLAVEAATRGDALRLVSGVVFGTTALLLFSTSCLYHATRGERLKSLMRVLDHSAIYLLIAGTYTPFTIGVMRGAWGWSLFGVIWGLAVLGVASKLTIGFRYPRLSTALYLGMGWAAMDAVQPLAANLSAAQLRWLVAGGLLYTAGVPFYIWKRRRYTHAIWHLFVLGGVACHFVAVLGVMGPRTA